MSHRQPQIPARTKRQLKKFLNLLEIDEENLFVFQDPGAVLQLDLAEDVGVDDGLQDIKLRLKGRLMFFSSENDSIQERID